jgi:hypothetical protein
MQYHPRLQLGAFENFQFDDAMRAEYGLFGPSPPPLSDEHKAKILGENYACLHGLDIDALKAGIADDDFQYDPDDPVTPWSTTSVADQVVGVTA